MLSRASRNAYSWWWASHIRTKQSKWLDQNIQDMEEKVEYILKIITEDGDSFRVRAEQYYQKRPELINFVEDTFRAYRALAERYDHMSTDLQSANRTIAMIFPERVQMSIEEEEYEDFPSNFDEYENIVITTNNSHVPAVPILPLSSKQNHPPKMESVVHQAMVKKKAKIPTKMMSKKGLVKLGIDDNASRVSKISRLSNDEAIDEINKLQKDILGSQTEKEFVKSSYESALSKYWEIENNINEMHTKISNLQHEFAVGEAMDDQDAQTLMSSSALNMCKDTLEKIKYKQKRFKTEAATEHHRVDDIRKRFESLIAQNNNNTDLKNLEQTNEHVKDKKAKIEKKELKSFEENVHNPIKEKSGGNDQIEEVTISEVAEKIEQLVDKVIGLETNLSSQTALVMRLRFEIDELNEKVQSLEQDNINLLDESNNKNIKIKKIEQELERVLILNKQIKAQNAQLEDRFDEASVSIDSLSNDLLIAKPDEHTQEDDDLESFVEMEKVQKVPILEEKEKENDDLEGFVEMEKVQKVPILEEKEKEKDDLEGFVKKSSEEIDEGEHLAFTESQNIRNDQNVACSDEENQSKSNLLFSHDIDDREKMLLEEYTSTMKNFKELKQKLKETEKRNRARLFKSAVHMKILRKANDSKDAEIRTLCEKLKLLETNMENQELELTKEIVETPHCEIQKARELVDEEEEDSQEHDETIDLDDEETQTNKDHEISEIEEEIRAEIDDLRKENLELWLRFSTSYHQINRFQDSVHDLLQEIKEVQDKKHGHGSGKLRLHHRHSPFELDIRPLYRHLRDMQTEVVLWVEKSGILEDDLQHRLTSLSDIQNELSALTNDGVSESESEAKNHVQLNNYQAAKFQGEVSNMKQENVKVINELREASERVRMLQFDIEKTLSKLDEELGQMNKSHSSSRIPFKSILFGSKLRKKHKHSLFTHVHPSLQRKNSNLKELP